MVDSRNERDSEVITTEHCVNTDTLALSSVSGAVETTTDAADTLAIAKCTDTSRNTREHRRTNTQVELGRYVPWLRFIFLSDIGRREEFLARSGLPAPAVHGSMRPVCCLTCCHRGKLILREVIVGSSVFFCFCDASVSSRSVKAATLHVLVPCCCSCAFVGCSSALVSILCLKEGSLRSDLLRLVCRCVGVSSTVNTGCVIKDVDGLMLCETEASHTKLRPDKSLVPPWSRFMVVAQGFQQSQMHGGSLGL